MTKQVNDLMEPVLLPLAENQVVFSALTTVLGVISVIGSIKLMNLSGPTWPRIAAILNLIPLCASCACVLGLPVGIWVLLVLGNPDVKAAMRPQPSLEV